MATPLWTTYDQAPGLDGGDAIGCWQVFGYRPGTSGAFSLPVNLTIQGLGTYSLSLFDVIPGGYNPVVTGWNNGPGQYFFIYTICQDGYCLLSRSVIFQVDECCNVLVVLDTAGISCTYQIMNLPVGEPYPVGNPNQDYFIPYSDTTPNAYSLNLSRDCVVWSNCDGEVYRSTETSSKSLIRRWAYENLPIGAKGNYINVTYGSWFTGEQEHLTLHCSPDNYTPGNGLNPADLVYNGSNLTAFANAIKQALINAYQAQGDTSKDFPILTRVNEANQWFMLAFRNKLNATSQSFYYPNGISSAGGCSTFDNSVLLLDSNNNGISHDGSSSFYDNSGLEPATWGEFVGGVFERCSYTVPGCGEITQPGIVGFGLANTICPGSHPTTPPEIIQLNYFNFNVQSSEIQCSNQVELSVLLSGNCVGTPVYNWYNNGNLTGYSGPVIQVPQGSGLWEVVVTGCEGCDGNENLSDNVIV